MALKLTEGWSAPIQLLLTRLGVAETGLSSSDILSLILRRADGVLVATSSNVTFTSSDAKVVYTPDPGDLLQKGSPYAARIKRVDPTGRIMYYPSGEADSWIVFTP